jgi:uncharacterized protein
MVFVKWTFILAAAIYFGFAALMYVAQRALMYFPEVVRTAPAAAGFPQAEEVWLTPADGERVIAWHGNGGSLRLRVDRFQKLTAAGIGLIALSYRGYGGSSGKPTEAGLIADARAAYDFAAERYAGRIALWGESLGTGVAVALAAEKPVARVILESPYTSTLEVAAANYWFLPVRLLMKDQFRSDERIAHVKAPVLILHGEADGIIPIQYGERLYALVPGEKRLVRFPRGGHNDLDDFGATEEALKFLR